MERSKAGTKKKEVPTAYQSLPNQNKHKIVIFYKKCKKYNEIQLTKNKMDLKKFKNKQFTSLTSARAYLPRARSARSSG